MEGRRSLVKYYVFSSSAVYRAVSVDFGITLPFPVEKAVGRAESFLSLFFFFFYSCLQFKIIFIPKWLFGVECSAALHIPFMCILFYTRNDWILYCFQPSGSILVLLFFPLPELLQILLFE